MEVFIKDEEFNKYESFAFSGYYHTYRMGEENIGKKNCLVQDFWSDDCEELPKLLVKTLKQHDNEVNIELKNEVERLKTELAELKQNAIVPKFKINYIVWYVGNDKVQKGTIEEIRYYKTTGISYYLPDLQRETFWIYENELFATKAEAKEALKKLEEV